MIGGISASSFEVKEAEVKNADVVNEIVTLPIACASPVPLPIAQATRYSRVAPLSLSRLHSEIAKLGAKVQSSFKEVMLKAKLESAEDLLRL